MNVKCSSKIKFSVYLLQVGVLDQELLSQFNTLGLDDDGLYDFLVKKNIITSNYYRMLEKQYNEIEYVDLISCEIDQSLVHLLPETLVKSCNGLLIKKDSGSYIFSMTNPLDNESLDRVRSYLQSYVKPVLCNEYDLKRIIYLLYRHFDRYDEFGYRKVENSLGQDSKKEVDAQEIFEAMLYDAFYLNASDIHIESNKKNFRVRTRIDGALQERVINNTRLGEKLFQFLKMLGRLDVSESMVPQDGGFDYIIDNKTVFVRLSVVPIEQGISAVVRILEHAVDFENLDDIIPTKNVRDEVRRFLRKKEGVMLITGPTGSGKTTTLYTCVKEINTPENKIISIEDPVELMIPRVNQIQVSPDGAFDFASALKFTLRQDPDVILLGEIRDEETANISTRAAITGHKVLSTLHTIDTITAINRLINLKVPGYQIASSLELVLAQRLVRKICSYCKVEYVLSESEKKIVCDLLSLDNDLSSYRFSVGYGCNACQQTGFQGRIALFEMLSLDVEMKELISFQKYQEFKILCEKKLKGSRLLDQAFQLACMSEITISELLSL